MTSRLSCMGKIRKPSAWCILETPSPDFPYTKVLFASDGQMTGKCRCSARCVATFSLVKTDMRVITRSHPQGECMLMSSIRLPVPTIAVLLSVRFSSPLHEPPRPNRRSIAVPWPSPTPTRLNIKRSSDWPPKARIFRRSVKCNSNRVCDKSSRNNLPSSGCDTAWPAPTWRHRSAILRLSVSWTSLWHSAEEAQRVLQDKSMPP